MASPTLITAAKIARQLGFAVRASKNRAGRISSYYCDGPMLGPDRRALRISDHIIPATAHRESVAEVMGHGSFNGYPGPEIVLTEPKSATWLRRAIILAANGRDVPGMD